MNLHDLITEIEAEIASLFARFRAHPAVQAAVVPATIAPGTPVVAPPALAQEDVTHRMLEAEAASKPQEVAQAPAAVAALDFSDSTLDFNVVRGQNILVSGTVSKKFVNCPTPTWVQTIGGSGSTLTANDQSRTEPNGQAQNRLTVTPVNGEVDVTVVCDDSGRTDLSILAAPQ